MDRDKVIGFLDDWFFGPQEQEIVDKLDYLRLNKDEPMIDKYEEYLNRMEEYRLYIKKNLI